ncbi:MAG: Mbeg1-like protein, partial [Bifidobacterium bifidum]
MRVVRSDQKGVMQHLTFSWQVSGNDFEYLPQVSPSSQLFNRSLNGWLESLSTEDRERAVDALFSVLRSIHADSISDLMAAGLKAVPTMINTFVGLSEADRRHLIEAMGLLMAAVRSRPRCRLVPELCFANRENGQFCLFSDHPPHNP